MNSVQGAPFREHLFIFYPFHMKHLLFIICVVGLTLLSFNNKPGEPAQITDSFANSYIKSFADLNGYLAQLIENGKAEQKIEIDDYYTLRNKLKGIEHWMAYLDEAFYVQHINGAPLPKLDPDVPRIELFKPKGLQRIDELMFEEASLAETLEQLELFQTQLNALYNRHKTVHFEHRFLYEACRRQIIRIFTLGITGFDTPGSQNGLTDCISSLKSMHKDLSASSLQVDKELLSSLKAAISYMEANTDFETFDRLVFLRNHLNPLYKALLIDQKDKNIELPGLTTHLPQPVNYEADNIFDQSFLNVEYYGLDISNLGVNTEAVKYLGETLFIDPALSADNKRACVSCHAPEQAFTDGVAKSVAFGNKGTIDRNSPTLLNAVYADKYFYDLRAPHLIEQVNHVVGSNKEFNTTFEEIVDKLKTSHEYDSLFRKAFPHINRNRISQYTISFALAAYVQQLVALNAPFDQYVRYETNTISADVQEGFNLFMGKAACATCHFPPTFSGLVPPIYMESESEVLGIPEDPDSEDLVADTDNGRYGNGWEKEKTEIYKASFKTPTLRNIELTAPYMHNGSFKDLNAVITFYNHGGGNGNGLDFPHQTLPEDSLHLSDHDIHCLTVFMNSLTDTANTSIKVKTLPAIPGLEGRRIRGEY